MKLTVVFMVFLSFFSSFFSGCSAVDRDGLIETQELFIEEIGESFPGRTVTVYDASELDGDTLASRGSAVYVGRVVGFVSDPVTGDGYALNAGDAEHNYISYRGCGQAVRRGTLMVTYLVYEPDDDGVDNIILREDFILSRAFETEGTNE